MMNISLEEIAKIYWDNIWKLHRIPRKILSNREPQFASKFIKKLIKMLRTKRQLLMIYHSQTDSQTKRINQKIGMFLWYYVNYQQDDWTDWLAPTEFQYNNKRYTTMGKMLFELNFGRYLWKRDLIVQMDIPQVEEFLIRLQKSWEQTTKAMKEV